MANILNLQTEDLEISGEIKGFSHRSRSFCSPSALRLIHGV